MRDPHVISSRLGVKELNDAKQLRTKQTTRPGTESQKWSSHGGLSVGTEEGRTGEKVPGIRSISGSYKTDRGRLRIVQEMEKPKNLYVQPTDMN